MTIFVASLFLPHTVHFDVDKEEKSSHAFLHNPSARGTIGDITEETPALSIFTPGPQRATDGITAPAYQQDHHTDFFIAGHEINKARNNDIDQASKNGVPLNSLPAVTPSEPHSPAWGRKSAFNQPKSRAGDLPPPSVLQHAHEVEKKFHSRQASLAAEMEKHERDLKAAEWSIQPAEQGNPGLRNAVCAACRVDDSLEKTWVGTLGMPTDALDPSRKNDIESKLELDHDCVTVFSNDSDLDGHYSHYCKTILWPMFHYQIPDNPKSKAYEDHSWVYYVKVNQEFADSIVKRYKRGDVIWIHDYHLLLVPNMIREKLPDAQIGLFLHVAFPSSEVFRCLSVRDQLLKGMLGANLIGFQIQEYGLHFLQTCSRLLNVEATPNGVQLEDRFVNVAAYPIGLDLKALGENRKADNVQEWITKVQQKYDGKFLIVARDKLDHIRGVRQKLLAYELFLNKYPEFREKVVLIQVATSTAEQQPELESMVAEVVTRINSDHSTLAHQPLVFLRQDMEYNQYLALLSSADAFMITSVREGMNLTSHEYISCQDGKYGQKKHGVLILSEFTGSSSLFERNDLPVNPWDLRQCAEAIRIALTMQEAEKERRWAKLMELVKVNDAGHWFNGFVTELELAWKQHSRQHTMTIPRLSTTKLCEAYKRANSRLFMIDYEGTLSSRDNSSALQFNNPQRTIDVLTELSAKEGNIVYVMSGKRPEELHMLFERVPGLGLVAENGCFVRCHDSDDWDEAANLDEVKEFQESILKIVEYYCDRTEGSFIETLHSSVIFVTKDAVDPVGASRTAGECANHINDVGKDMQIHAVPIPGGLIIESTRWSKGTAAHRIYDKIKEQNVAVGKEPPSFLFVAGDSRDDEVIYRWANKLGADQKVRDVTTVSVTTRNTEAMSTLTQGVTGVLSALRKLAALESFK